MAGRLRGVALFLALGCAPALAQQAQQVDPNLRALLGALMNGSQVALLTPLANGTVQVTSFAAPGQRSAAEAAALIEQARINLGNLGITRPTGEQLARALAGGTVVVPSGSTSIAGVLPPGAAPTVTTQVITSGNLPLVVAPSPGGVTAPASAGGSASPPPGTAVPPLGTPTPFTR